MNHSSEKPMGFVAVPAMLCALTGTLLAVGLDFMGYFGGLNQSLLKLWRAEPFLLDQNAVSVGVEYHWPVAMIMSLLVAWFVLDSAFIWRRLLVGAMMLTAVLGFAPALMLWGIVVYPFAVAAAVLWTWFCAVVYTSQHLMPCEKVGAQTPPEREEVSAEEPTERVELHTETIPFPVKAPSLNTEKYAPADLSEAANKEGRQADE